MTYQPKLLTDFGATTDSRIQKDQFVLISNQDREHSSYQVDATQSQHLNDDTAGRAILNRSQPAQREQDIT